MGFCIFRINNKHGDKTRPEGCHSRTRWVRALRPHPGVRSGGSSLCGWGRPHTGRSGPWRPDPVPVASRCTGPVGGGSGWEGRGLSQAGPGRQAAAPRGPVPVARAVARAPCWGARRPGSAAGRGGVSLPARRGRAGRVRRQEMAAVLQLQLPGPPAPHCRAQAA